jgi:AcrR family transcriptional regulator
MPRPANPTLRDDILAAALRLVEEKGAVGLTMREVAGALGYSATAIYQHFKSKEDLLLALKLQAGDLLAAEMEAARQEPTIEAQFHAMGRRYVHFGLENPAYYRLIFQDSVPGLEFTSEHLGRMRRSWAIMRDTLKAWAETWRMRDIDADREANVIWAMAHGITSLALAGRFPFTDHQKVFALFELAASRWMSGMLNMQSIQTKKHTAKPTKSRRRRTTKHPPVKPARRTVV